MGWINKLKTHQKIFLFAILVVVAISLFDLMSMNSKLFGNTQDYTQGNFGVNWWPLFFNINLLFIGLICASYYWFGRQDFSETISLGIGSVVLWFCSVPDVLFFWLRQLPVPSVLPWLSSGPVVKLVMNALHLTVVTNTLIYGMAIVSLISVYNLTKYLERIN